MPDSSIRRWEEELAKPRNVQISNLGMKASLLRFDRVNARLIV